MTRWGERLSFEPAFAGRHWSTDEEFDWVVLDHARRQAAVVEIKWSAKPVNGARLLSDLERRVGQCLALIVEHGGVVVRRREMTRRRFVVVSDPPIEDQVRGEENQRNVPRKFTAMTRSHSFTSIVSTV